MSVCRVCLLCVCVDLRCSVAGLRLYLSFLCQKIHRSHAHDSRTNHSHEHRASVCVLTRELPVQAFGYVSLSCACVDLRYAFLGL